MTEQLKGRGLPPALSNEPLESLCLTVDDEAIAIDGDLTLGRHLNNDVIVPGEDVLDYHLRLEVSARAVTAHPLLDATVEINGQTLNKPIGIAPGDTLGLGATIVVLGLMPEATPAVQAEPIAWKLQPISAPEPGLAISTARATVGRSDKAELCIPDDHISRHHAEVWADRYVWLRDLGSANGSTVNGQPISGAVRLFHGDYVGFDNFRYQVIGTGGDLTPILLAADSLPEPLDNTVNPIRRNDTTEFGVADANIEQPAVVLPNIVLEPGQETMGSILVGASEPVNGQIFRTPIGRALVGRGPSCDFCISDQTVSLQHAELMSRAEGCTITNLMATNGTWVNGINVQSHLLQDGDIVRLGRVTLMYKDTAIKPADQKLMQRVQVLLLFGSLIAAGTLALLLL